MKFKFVSKRSMSLALAVLMAAGSVTVLPQTGVIQAEAAETYVKDADLSSKNTAVPAKDDVVPSANQYEYQKQELAAFCHFGPNTFNEIEWGENYGTQTPDEIFTLETDFDADTMIKTLKDAGFSKIIVTAKHHDGFCIWNSAYTTYDVAETSYKDGKGDILAEISAACTKYDMDMGLYLSPWDIHEASYGYYDAEGNATTKENDVLDYNEYYNNQLIEILSQDDKYGNKGHFTEVWMDGAKGSGANAQEYDFEKWFETIQYYEGTGNGKYESDCMLFGAQAYTTVRWIGNENGYANEETWAKSKADFTNNTIDSNSIGSYTKGYEDGNIWTVPECDARITSGWFWGTTKKAPKSVEALAEMYFRSVGYNSTLLLNVPPNNQGSVDQAILDRVTEFGENIKETFDVNLAANAVVSATEVRGNDTAYKPSNVLDGKDDTYWTVNDGTTTGSLVIDLGGTKKFDVVSIEEAIQFGQRIKSFKVEYRKDGGEWQTFDEGTTIGSKRLSRKAPVSADELCITVTTSSAVPMISEVGVYKASEGFELSAGAPDGMDVLDERDANFTYSDGWYQESGSQYLNNTNVYCDKSAGKSVTVKFTGTKFYLVGTKDPNHGKATVTVDGGSAVTIDTYSATRATGAIIYESEDLSDGEHTIVFTSAEAKALGIEGAYVINNEGLGMVGIESSKYTMDEDSAMMVKLVRVGAADKAVTVTVSPNPGSAIQDDFDTECITTVTFAVGETEKEVPVRTRRNTNKTGDQYFTIELTCENEDVILGFNQQAKITIKDTESIDLSKYFQFPSKVKASATVEAESFELDPISGDKYVRINDKTWDGETVTTVDWFETGNKIHLEYYAQYAGTYTVKATYRSGRKDTDTPNAFVWNGSKMESGSLDVYGESGATTTHVAEFDIVVTEPGLGEWTFVADEKAGPVIDKFEIIAKDLEIEFEDIKEEEKFYYTPVYWAADNGITTGKGSDTFDALGEVTRGEMVTFLWRLAGEPDVEGTHNFTDVQAGRFYEKAVIWAVSENIVKGTSATTFSPNDPVSRAQVVTFLHRYTGEAQATASVNFKDVSSKKYYYQAVAWAAENNVTGGNTDGTFGPNQSCSRGQAVTFLYRAANLK